jgi:hypothetical protein
MAIWQDLVWDYGFASSYQSVKRYIHKRRGSQLPQAMAVILNAPGEEAQVDWSTTAPGPMVRDPQRGKYRRTRLFVMTRGYSRKSVRLLVFHSSSRIWAELHEKAFRRLGGSTHIVVLDNLREGVLVPICTILPSILFIATSWRITARWPCRAGSKIPIAETAKRRNAGEPFCITTAKRFAAVDFFAVSFARGCLRLRTLNCCRSAKFSVRSLLREQKQRKTRPSQRRNMGNVHTR